MSDPTRSQTIHLSPATTEQVKAQLQRLARLIPDVELLKDCDDDCQEIHQMAGLLQQKLTKYLHVFGHRK